MQMEQQFWGEMRIRFFVRNTKSSKPVKVYSALILGNSQIRLSTGYRVYSQQWNKKTQRGIISIALSAIDNRNNKILNEKLDEISNKFQHLRHDVCSNMDNKECIIRKFYDIMGKKAKDEKIKPWLWLGQHIADTDTKAQNYHSFFQFFENWAKNNISCWGDINQAKIDEFVKHLISQNFSVSWHNNILFIVCKSLQAARDDNGISWGDSENVISRLKKARKSNRNVEDNGKISLTDSQINDIYNISLTDSKLEIVRDLFIFGCLTGLRKSDFLGKDFSQYRTTKENYFSVVQTKEKASRNVIVDISDNRTKGILEKYSWIFPNININSQLKIREIVKLLPWGKDKVQYKVSKAKGIEVSEKEIWEIIGFHTARRSKITNLYRQGVNVEDIQNYIGHADIKMTQKYIKATTDERAKRVINRTKQQDTITTGNNLSTGELMGILLKDIALEDWNKIILTDIKRELANILPYRESKDISPIILANLKLREYLSAQKEKFLKGQYLRDDEKQAKGEYQALITELVRLIL